MHRVCTKLVLWIKQGGSSSNAKKNDYYIEKKKKLHDRTPFYKDHLDDSDNEFAYLRPSVYKEIFGGTRINLRKKVSILKISHKNNSIYREYRQDPHIGEQYIGLTYRSIIGLLDSDYDFDSLQDVEITKGSWFCYYWNHPFHATLVSMRIGIISLVFGFLSIVISIFF